MMQPTGTGTARWLTAATVGLIALLVAMTMISQFYRNSVGVLVPDLVRDLALSPVETGLLTSVFFLVFAAAQIPVGIALDRFGPALTMAVSCLVAVAGALVFASAGRAGGLLVGRILLGLGCASFLMAPLAIYARLYPKDRFSTLTGIQLGFGSLGALIATAPFALLIGWLGWRIAFAATGMVAAAGAAAVFLILHGSRADQPAETRETLAASLAGVGEVARQPGAAALFLMHCVAYSTFVTMLGLWGGAYLAHVHGLSLAERGNILFVFAATQIIGLLSWGPSDRLFASYRRPVTIGAASSATLLAGLALAGPFPLPVMMVWFAAFGFSCAYTPVLLAHGKSLFPARLTGRGITIMNIGTMGGAFFFQTVTGAIMGLFAPSGAGWPLIAYKTIFLLQAVSVLAILMVYRSAPDPRPTLGA